MHLTVVVILICVAIMLLGAINGARPVNWIAAALGFIALLLYLVGKP
jgi:hypothetical protein